MYLMEESSRDAMSSDDPFSGKGVFLDAPGVPGQVMLDLLGEILGKAVPAVAWDDIGVWIDPGSCGMNEDSIRKLWDGGKASERR